MSDNPIVIDCDVGVDDAVAIALCLAQNQNLIGITCVHGNTSLENVTKNTAWVTSVCKRPEIPVFGGAEKSFIGDNLFAHEFHGEGGLGGMSAPSDKKDSICDEHAVSALLRMTKERPGEITLLAIGPLTNVGLAIRMDPGFSKRLKELIIMGGNTTGKGAVRPGAEFNFSCDPEAAHVVVQEMECPVTIVPFETCYDTGLPWEWYDSLAQSSSSVCRFLSEITSHSTVRQQNKGKPTFVMCDALAAAIAIDKKVITEVRRGPIHVERSGMYTRGQMMEMSALWDGDKAYSGPPVDVVIKADGERFYSLMNGLKNL
ncbi:Inosine-uridine preferring nucleoside hydrolase [Holothuria leucospilota]|uniref:Inosine-uridine preferring nucleoside hydrolase n=1 Tax=Holothuria leucospilota TaxID=206669 RepID=A0A9Q1C5C9_HOLLE|nr:Inosine-uridine preferring nucleoside hydrolase [Holothuria leucospilota]